MTTHLSNFDDQDRDDNYDEVCLAIETISRRNRKTGIRYDQHSWVYNSGPIDIGAEITNTFRTSEPIREFICRLEKSDPEAAARFKARNGVAFRSDRSFSLVAGHPDSNRLRTFLLQTMAGVVFDNVNPDALGFATILGPCLSKIDTSPSGAFRQRQWLDQAKHNIALAAQSISTEFSIVGWVELSEMGVPKRRTRSKKTQYYWDYYDQASAEEKNALKAARRVFIAHLHFVFVGALSAAWIDRTAYANALKLHFPLNRQALVKLRKTKSPLRHQVAGSEGYSLKANKNASWSFQLAQLRFDGIIGNDAIVEGAWCFGADRWPKNAVIRRNWLIRRELIASLDYDPLMAKAFQISSEYVSTWTPTRMSKSDYAQDQCLPLQSIEARGSLRAIFAMAMKTLLMSVQTPWVAFEIARRRNNSR